MNLWLFLGLVIYGTGCIPVFPKERGNRLEWRSSLADLILVYVGSALIAIVLS